MSRQFWFEGRWLDEDEYAFQKADPSQLSARSDLPRPYIASDIMPETQHPCTGEFFTSKAKFRAVTRAHNCEEVGNDPARLRPKPKTKPDRRSIRQSIKKAAEIVASRS